MKNFPDHCLVWLRGFMAKKFPAEQIKFKLTLSYFLPIWAHA